jgi:hypothetical protein
MKRFCLLAMAFLAIQTIQGADGNGQKKEPPVLRDAEPSDSVVVTLPGLKTATGEGAEAATEVHLTPPPPDPDRPVFRRAKRAYPPEFDRDSADYLNQQIGIWEQMDAQALLGDPLGQRPSYADDQTVNGQIVSFNDPSGRYKQFELDFDRESGRLRTLFVYPLEMTWTECRTEFGMNVRTTQANKGRTFYSYLDRRLDVLVDAAGKVISLGMY